jgi:hypothetical protein
VSSAPSTASAVALAVHVTPTVAWERTHNRSWSSPDPFRDQAFRFPSWYRHSQHQLTTNSSSHISTMCRRQGNNLPDMPCLNWGIIEPVVKTLRPQFFLFINALTRSCCHECFECFDFLLDLRGIHPSHHFLSCSILRERFARGREYAPFWEGEGKARSSDRGRDTMRDTPEVYVSRTVTPLPWQRLDWKHSGYARSVFCQHFQLSEAVEWGERLFRLFFICSWVRVPFVCELSNGVRVWSPFTVICHRKQECACPDHEVRRHSLYLNVTVFFISWILTVAFFLITKLRGIHTGIHKYRCQRGTRRKGERCDSVRGECAILMLQVHHLCSIKFNTENLASLFLQQKGE